MSENYSFDCIPVSYTHLESKKHLFKAKEGDSLGARIQQAIGRVMVFADCAHALGASKEGKMAGEWADFSSFSFHAVKNFTTAEGGACLLYTSRCV